jgi:methionyl aminopeptidase
VVEGDIVSVDLGAMFEGYNGDNAATFACGDISPEAKRLMDTTKKSLYEGIKAACVGGRIGDIGSAVQRYVESEGFSVVRQFVGHGIGTKLHEAPEVPNFGTQGRGIRLMPVMTLAIEPMINIGTSDVKVMPDGWTVLTKDGSLSAHFEHTIVITADGPKILTKP